MSESKSPRSSRSASSRLSKASGVLSRTMRTTALLFRRQLWVWPLLALVLMIVLGVWVRRAIERPLKENLRNELTTVLEAENAAVQIWIAEQKRYLETIARDVSLREPITALLEIAAREPETSSGLLNAPAAEMLREHLNTVWRRDDFNGYVVFDMTGRVLASNAEAIVGERPYAVDSGWLPRALGGRVTVTPPFESVVLLPDITGQIRSGVPTMFVLAPAHDAAGKQIAVIAIRIRPDADFTRVFAIARSGESGETYAMSKEGVMLSLSRFDEELKQIGLLTDDESTQSILTIELRDPGVDMRGSTRPALRRSEQPFTRMAQELMQEKSGSDVDGYRDYRGVEVVGAWMWLPEQQYGIATEIDTSEAFRSIYILRNIFWGLYGLIGLAAIAIFIFTLIVSRLNRLARKAVLEAKKLGQYSIGEKLGSGGMGVVYRANHEMLRRPTAVKLLNVESTSSDSIARFEREVRLTSQLNHPNTVTVFDYGRTPEGVFYFAMELLDGLDLETAVTRYGPMPDARVVHILRQICGSLSEAHGKGLVHRDIKPANLMLTTRAGIRDFVKVLDFGLVKALDAKAAATLTAAGSWAGTPLYLAPEAITSPEDVDPRSDLYAVGAVGYFLLTGATIFEAESVTKIIHQQLHADVVPPSARSGRPVAVDLEVLLMSCLAKSPADRPQSAADLARDLARCNGNPWTNEDAESWWVAYIRDMEARAAGQGSTATVVMKTPIGNS